MEILLVDGGRASDTCAVNSKPLTGWLIFLIFIMVSSGLAGYHDIAGVDKIFPASYRDRHPSAETALTAYKILVGCSILAGLYVAWILIQRVPGTLVQAQWFLVAKVVFGIAGAFAFPVLGGFPGELGDRMMWRAYYQSAAAIVGAAAWLLYLARSKRVKDIFTESEMLTADDL